MTPELTEELKLRAVAIADSLMRHEIDTLGVSDVDVIGDPYGLIGEDGCEVRTLAEADAMLRAAFEYLRDRGLARLVTDAYGEQIQLVFRCERCGCTDTQACPDGCYWVSLEPMTGTGICSACDPGEDGA